MGGLEPVKTIRRKKRSTQDLKANAENISQEGFAFVTECIKFVEEHGLEEPGIYRISGVKSKFQRLITQVDKGKVPSLEGEELITVTSALKQYFRELGKPLFTFALHDSFIEAASKRLVSLKGYLACSFHRRRPLFLPCL
jgi:hypothetical protein